MAFFWNRRPERGPATNPVDSRSASALAIGASNRHAPSHNNWAPVALFGTIAVLYFAREILTVPEEKPLVELYDSVLIPVLSLVEQDRHKGAIYTTREEFLFLSINEMITEFSEYQLAHYSSQAEDAAASSGPAERLRARIICLPANDRADEVTAAMLAQILEQAGHAALSLPIAHASLLEMLALLEIRQDDVICISALPPFAFPPARTMCKLIRERFPKVKLVVGVWGFSGDTEKAKARFERTQPDRLLTSLAQAVEQIQELLRPMA